MTKAVWTKFITDNAGAVVEGASVTVFLSDGITPATIFSDPAGTSKANPFLTPAGGKAEFYADPGIYVIQASKDGKTATWNNEEIGHARRDLDLSDLESAANARNNLGLKSAALADITGTVSQSGGVPTGAVIERGGDINGEYTKFADGTLECWTVMPLTYTSIDSLRASWTFPHQFVDSKVNISGIATPFSYSATDFLLTTVSRTTGISALTEGTSRATATTAFLQVGALSGGSFDPSDYIQVKVCVKGRWY